MCFSILQMLKQVFFIMRKDSHCYNLLLLKCVDFCLLTNGVANFDEVMKLLYTTNRGVDNWWCDKNLDVWSVFNGNCCRQVLSEHYNMLHLNGEMEKLWRQKYHQGELNYDRAPLKRRHPNGNFLGQPLLVTPDLHFRMWADVWPNLGLKDHKNDCPFMETTERWDTLRQSYGPMMEGHLIWYQNMQYPDHT